MTLGTIHKYRGKTSNTVSESVHSNWIMLSYYSGPKHKECFLNTSLTSVHSNVEHKLVILTESFSPQICLTQPLLLKSKAEVMW